MLSLLEGGSVRAPGTMIMQRGTLTHLPLSPIALLPDLPSILRQTTPSCAIKLGTGHPIKPAAHSPNRKCQPSKSASCRESTAQLSRPNGPSRDSSKSPLPALSSVLSWSPSSISWALESGWSLPLSSSKPASPKPAGTVELDTQNYTGMAHGEDQASCNPHIQPQLCSAPPPQSLWGCDQAPQQHRDIDRIKPKHKLKQSSTSNTQDGGEGEKGRGQNQN